MDIKKGQIYYIDRGFATGSEQWADRPGIIVSNDKNNKHSRTVEVVYLTTQPKMYLPTHVTICSTGRESTALCEQITSVSIERLGNYIGEISAAEMTQLEIGMLISLDMQIPAGAVEPAKEDQTHKETLDSLKLQLGVSRATKEKLSKELEAEKAKLTALQWAYEALISRILNRDNSLN